MPRVLARLLVVAALAFSPSAAVAENAPDTRIVIISPSAGTIFTQGSPIEVVVQLNPPLTAANNVRVGFVGLGHFKATWTDGLHFTAVLPPFGSRMVSGPLTLTPEITDNQGNIAVGASVIVGVGPASPPLTLALDDHHHFPAPGSSPVQLYVSGKLADGSLVDLRSSLLGTSYSVSNPAVLGVSADGLVSILGAGYANVTVKNGALSDVATFVVQDPAHPLPPDSVVAQVSITRSGFVLNRTSGFFDQNVTLTNTSGGPLPGPLYLLVKNLSDGVTLVDQSGLTEKITPLGSPYREIPLPDGLTLPANASASFTLSFLNPARVSIGYTIDVIRTSAIP